MKVDSQFPATVPNSTWKQTPTKYFIIFRYFIISYL